MKKLIIAAIASIAISTSAMAAEQCTATDLCMLFTNMDDLAMIATLYQQGAEILPFLINEMVVAGKIIKLDRGRNVQVVAKSGLLYQVYHNGRLLYTINLAVNCR